MEKNDRFNSQSDRYNTPEIGFSGNCDGNRALGIWLCDSCNEVIRLWDPKKIMVHITEDGTKYIYHVECWNKMQKGNGWRKK